MTLVLAGASIGLLLFPGLGRGAGRRLGPSRWRRLSGVSLVAGWIGLQLALVLHAAPTALQAVCVPALKRLCEWVPPGLAPGGPALGWVAAAALLVTGALALLTWRRWRRDRQALVIEPAFGTHFPRSGYELIVLPTHRPVAYSVSARPPQVVVSDGVLGCLDNRQRRLLLSHEEAHVRSADQRLLVLAALVAGALGWMPGVRRSSLAVRVAVERAADEEAAGACVDDRLALADALLVTARSSAEIGVAAFNATEGLEHRVVSLRTTQPAALSGWARTGLVLGSIPLAATIGAVAAWVVRADQVVVMAGIC